MSEALGPANKRLRSSKPDLVVVVGDEPKEYHYHSQVMATHSKYIDTMLANSTRESQTGHIDFPNLRAEVWESMIYFLDPLAARQMTVQDALKVAAAYYEYGFCVGVKCCDQVLFEIMPCGNYEPDKNPEDFKQLIDAFLLADAANLKQTKKRAVQYFKEALDWALVHGHLIFSETQLKKLAPLIAKENLLGESFTRDDILQSHFPKLFIKSCIISKSNQIFDRAVIGLRVSGHSNRDFELTAESTCRRFESQEYFDNNDGIPLILTIERLTDGWVIYETPNVENRRQLDERNILWKNPLSKDMPFPPELGWVSADERATGKPKIEYLYQTEKK